VAFLTAHLANLTWPKKVTSNEGEDPTTSSHRIEAQRSISSKGKKLPFQEINIEAQPSFMPDFER
jgi:hypothetical protein